MWNRVSTWRLAGFWAQRSSRFRGAALVLLFVNSCCPKQSRSLCLAGDAHLPPPPTTCAHTFGPSPRNLACTWGFPDRFTSIRCSMASVLVETVAFRIDFAHLAIPSKPGVYLGIPRSFHFESLLHGFRFLWKVSHFVSKLHIGPSP